MDVVFVTNHDDWTEVYVNDDYFYGGHDIPDFIWIRLLMSGPVSRVRKFSVDFQESPQAYGARHFSDIPITLLEEEQV